MPKFKSKEEKAQYIREHAKALILLGARTSIDKHGRKVLDEKAIQEMVDAQDRDTEAADRFTKWSDEIEKKRVCYTADIELPDMFARIFLGVMRTDDSDDARRWNYRLANLAKTHEGQMEIVKQAAMKLLTLDTERLAKLAAGEEAPTEEDISLIHLAWCAGNVRDFLKKMNNKEMPDKERQAVLQVLEARKSVYEMSGGIEVRLAAQNSLMYQVAPKIDHFNLQEAGYIMGDIGKLENEDERSFCSALVSAADGSEYGYTADLRKFQAGLEKLKKVPGYENIDLLKPEGRKYVLLDKNNNPRNIVQEIGKEGVKAEGDFAKENLPQPFDNNVNKIVDNFIENEEKKGIPEITEEELQERQRIYAEAPKINEVKKQSITALREIDAPNPADPAYGLNEQQVQAVLQEMNMDLDTFASNYDRNYKDSFTGDLNSDPTHLEKKYNKACESLKYAHSDALNAALGLELQSDDFKIVFDGASLEDVKKTPKYQSLSAEVKKVFPLYYDALLRDKISLEANRYRAEKMLKNLPKLQYKSEEVKAVLTAYNLGGFLRDEKDKAAIKKQQEKISDVISKAVIRQKLTGAATGARYANILLSKPGLSDEERNEIIQEARRGQKYKLFMRYRKDLLNTPQYLLSTDLTEEQVLEHYEEFDYYTMLGHDSGLMLTDNAMFMTEDEKAELNTFSTVLLAQNSKFKPSLIFKACPLYIEARFEDMKKEEIIGLISCKHKALENFVLQRSTYFDMVDTLKDDLDKALTAKQKLLERQEKKQNFANRNIHAGMVDLGGKDALLLPSEQIADLFEAKLKDEMFAAGKAGLSLELGEKTRYLGEYLKEIKRLRGSDGQLRLVTAQDMDRLLALSERAEKDLREGADPGTDRVKMADILALDRPILEAAKTKLQERKTAPLDSLVSAAKLQLGGDNLSAEQKNRIQAAADQYNTKLTGTNEAKGLYDTEIDRIKSQAADLDDNIWRSVTALAVRMDQILAAPKLINSDAFKNMRDGILNLAAARPASFEALSTAMQKLANDTAAYMKAKDTKTFGQGLVDEKDRGKRSSDSGKERYQFADDANRLAAEAKRQLDALKKRLERVCIAKDPEAGTGKLNEIWEGQRREAGNQLDINKIEAKRRELEASLNVRALPNNRANAVFADQMTEFASYMIAELISKNGREAEAKRMNVNSFKERAELLQKTSHMELMKKALKGKITNLKDMKKCFSACMKHVKDMHQFASMDDESLQKCLDDMNNNRGSMIHKTKVRVGEYDFDQKVLNLKIKEARKILEARTADRQHSFELAASDLKAASDFGKFAADIRSSVKIEKKSPYEIMHNALGTLALCRLLSDGKDMREIMLPDALKDEKRTAGAEAYRLMTGNTPGSEISVGKIFAAGLEKLNAEAKRIETANDITKPGFMNTPDGRMLRFVTDAMADISLQCNAGQAIDTVTLTRTAINEYLAQKTADKDNRAGKAIADEFIAHAGRLKSLADHQQAASKALGDILEKGVNQDDVAAALASIPGFKFSAPDDNRRRQAFAKDEKLQKLAEELAQDRNKEKFMLIAPFLQDGSLAPLFKAGNTNPETGTAPLTSVPSLDKLVSFVNKQKKELRTTADQGVKAMQKLRDEVLYSYAREPMEAALNAMKQLRDKYAVKDIIVTERTQQKYSALMETAMKGQFMAECVKRNMRKETAEHQFEDLKNSASYRQFIQCADTCNLASYLGNGGIRKTLNSLLRENETLHRVQGQRNAANNRQNAARNEEIPQNRENQQNAEQIRQG